MQPYKKQSSSFANYNLIDDCYDKKYTTLRRLPHDNEHTYEQRMKYKVRQ